MKGAWYPGQGRPILIENFPDPEPSPGELLIRVHRCGICGTDLSMTKGEAWDYGPGQFGHEYAGEVVALGRDVEGYRVGDRIAVLPSLSCDPCSGAHGNHVLCRHQGGVTQGFAELARVPARVAVKLPDTLSLADGALIEPMAISLYGVRLSRITPGDRVLVLGGGTVALYAIYWARRLGAGRIVAMSRSERRRDLSLHMGADAFIPYGDGEVGAVAEALGGPPVLVYECVGSPGMLGKALSHVGLFGRIVSLGFCTSPDPVMPAMASYKCATMQFVVGYAMRDFLYVADQMDKGHADPKALISNDIPLSAMPAMFEKLRGPNAESKVHVLL
ncbi:alcohol dehydrogenase catalytic domain-containing protein [Sphingobium sufflavum]|uniref:alcohol dehydrogenase catalytic domain-containing protein n=1 Tax=Sphingobium sufflavum TaxID=1129547 RepID=UPI001F32CBD8|nr:alcohol dehydrogenase catalytic domain-containing protein [Sphingobium sufflavum]MCE7797952.1 alcohol dehydrogenase catalytic domain-containing protein [Sphingobium sufflavum]